MDRSKLAIFLVAAAVIFVVLSLVVPDALGAATILFILLTILIPTFRKATGDPAFVTKVFLIALATRLGFGLLIYFNDWSGFFGGDANTYDFRGKLIKDYWLGLVPPDTPQLLLAMTTNGPGWGMNYLVAGIYYVFGENMLAAQIFCIVFGAATAPLIYHCAEKIFQNRSVARLSAIGVAIFPAFVVWSGQLLKDGLIVFLLVLTMTMVLKLQEKFSYTALILLVLSLFGIISLRFYIFYMVAVAVAGSFVVGVTNTPSSLLRRAVAIVVIGVGLTYLGVVRTASVDFERFGNLDQLQASRLDQARSADSGFAEDIDVSTTRGALTALPIGFIYLLMAPFPWQVTNFRQAITLPEVFVWWAMIPLLVWGAWYTIKNKLRAAFPILLFSGMLTLAYSIFQSNVGTAYRQRTQIQVFFFIFIAVGWTLYKERREDRKLIREARNRRLEAALGQGVEGLR